MEHGNVDSVKDPMNDKVADNNDNGNGKEEEKQKTKRAIKRGAEAG